MRETRMDIIGYVGIYQASNLGNIRTMDRLAVRTRRGSYLSYNKKGKKLSQGINKFGHKYVQLIRNHYSSKKEQTTHSVGKLVYCAFNDLDISKLKHRVGHKDGNHSNNNILNLETYDNGHNTRKKQAYSLYKDMLKKGISPNTVFDIGHKIQGGIIGEGVTSEKKILDMEGLIFDFIDNSNKGLCIDDDNHRGVNKFSLMEFFHWIQANK